MPTPESSCRNLEYARITGRVKFWRKRSESQRLKAEILQAYFAVPRQSQRAVAGRLHCKQPYVAKLFRKIKREGAEKAVGLEAYEIYKALRDVELTKRHEALIAEWQRGQGVPQTESRLPDETEPIPQAGPTEYVEWVRTTTGERMPVYGSRPYQAPTPQTPPQAAGIPIHRIWGPGREQTDNLLRQWAGITSTNRGNSWF